MEGRNNKRFHLVYEPKEEADEEAEDEITEAISSSFFIGVVVLLLLFQLFRLFQKPTLVGCFNVMDKNDRPLLALVVLFSLYIEEAYCLLIVPSVYMCVCVFFGGGGEKEREKEKEIGNKGGREREREREKSYAV
ncbi:hypothetical protein BDA99DRAFT_524150 [Phascolomyces articulosus]|uniref:Uncharacterized protein n=1 Tax=Phascolomyces articulosus TaxID=60185 RepID=A0AAD5P8Y2_9FUNG|nr:hypothetical protein BDA99DRAFT_524150 [Phascolomyces articulosus]